jgi:hypothetical protein
MFVCNMFQYCSTDVHVSAPYASSVQLGTRSCLCRTSLFSPRARHGEQQDDINATRHAQSVMGPECSNDHKESELCIIANNRHPLTTPRNSTICRHACLQNATSGKIHGVTVFLFDFNIIIDNSENFFLRFRFPAIVKFPGNVRLSYSLDNVIATTKDGYKVHPSSEPCGVFGGGNLETLFSHSTEAKL